MHEVPHELTLRLSAHSPPQLCLAPAQVPEQAAPLSMQLPLHSFCPDGHAPPQLPDVQVAVPPSGTMHGVQEVPQVAGSASLTQVPLQAW